MFSDKFCTSDFGNYTSVSKVNPFSDKKLPCTTFEMFNKCPKSSLCEYSHGEPCPNCLECNLPAWNQGLSHSHLETCTKKLSIQERKVGEYTNVYSDGRVVARAVDCDPYYCFYVPQPGADKKGMVFVTKQKLQKSLSGGGGAKNSS